MAYFDEFEYQQATQKYLQWQDQLLQEEIANCEKKKYSKKSMKIEHRREWRNSAAKALLFFRGDFVIHETRTQSYAIGRVQSLHVDEQGRPYVLIEQYTQEQDYNKIIQPVEPHYLQKVAPIALPGWLDDIRRVIEENLGKKNEYEWTWINNNFKWLNNLQCWIFVLESARDSRWQRQCWGSSTLWGSQNQTNIAEISLTCDSQEFQSIPMCEHSNGEKLKPKLSQGLLPASPFPALDIDWEVVIAEIASRQSSKLFQSCDQNLPLLKMFRDYYPARAHQVTAKDPIFIGSSKDFGRAGIMLNGAYYPAESLPRPSLESGYSWLPAPSALSSPPSSQHNPPGLSRLEGHLRKCNVLEKGECLNPEFIEACYNMPLGWTDPSVQSPATALIESAELRWETLSIGELPSLRSKESSISIPSDVTNPDNGSCVAEKKKTSGLSISFGYTCDRLLANKKTVTRRIWKEKYAKRFIKAYQEGKQIRAIDKDFRYGGKIVGWLTLTKEPRKGWTHEITENDCVKEGYPELSPSQFRDKFFRNSKDWSMPVWILEFEFEANEQPIEESESLPLDLSDLPLFQFTQRNITVSQAQEAVDTPITQSDTLVTQNLDVLDLQIDEELDDAFTDLAIQESDEGGGDYYAPSPSDSVYNGLMWLMTAGGAINPAKTDDSETPVAETNLEIKESVPVPAKSRLQNYIETLGNIGDLYATPGSRPWAVAIKSDETYEEFSQSSQPFGLGELPAEQPVAKQLTLDLGFSEDNDDSAWDKDCWRTPNNTKQPILDLVAEALGGTIGLDPTADNMHRVPAQRHFTKADNCLIQNWISPARTVFMNMPYSNPAPFLEKLVEQIERGNVREAIVLMPSASLQGIACSELIQRMAIGTCMWNKSRIAFLDKDGVPKKGADFVCSFVYFGDNWERFARVFRPWGLVFRLETKEPAVLPVEVLPPESRITDFTESWAAMDLAESLKDANLTESWGIADWQDDWPESHHLTGNLPDQILRDAIDVTATLVENENYAEPCNTGTLSNDPTEDALAESQLTNIAVLNSPQQELTEAKGTDCQDIAFAQSSSASDFIIGATVPFRKKRHALPDKGSGSLQKHIANASRSQGGNPYWLYKCTYIDKETGKQKRRTRYVSKSKYSRVHAMIEERRSCYEILKYLGTPKKKFSKQVA